MQPLIQDPRHLFNERTLTHSYTPYSVLEAVLVLLWVIPAVYALIIAFTMWCHRRSLPVNLAAQIHRKRAFTVTVAAILLCGPLALGGLLSVGQQGTGPIPTVVGLLTGGHSSVDKRAEFTDWAQIRYGISLDASQAATLLEASNNPQQSNIVLVNGVPVMAIFGENNIKLVDSSQPAPSAALAKSLGITEPDPQELPRQSTR